jgi:hypothetical protein
LSQITAFAAILSHFTDAVITAHQRDLHTLATEADSLCRASNQTGPWTETPGTDALVKLGYATTPVERARD